MKDVFSSYHEFHLTKVLNLFGTALKQDTFSTFLLMVEFCFAKWFKVADIDEQRGVQTLQYHAPPTTTSLI